jgi:pyruvate formate lyase activating enzyme
MAFELPYSGSMEVDMGFVFDIQRCCYHDGPGIRSTVFFKGCQLRCAWCHNPESFSMKPQLQYISEQCLSCKKCAEVCLKQVHTFDVDLHRVDFSLCDACGKCTEVCQTGALTLIGKEMSAKEVMEIALSDKAFYTESGGGITFSGGEPTLQPDFLMELLILSKENELHTCLETNGYIPPSYLKKAEPLIDLFLLDYKATDPYTLKSFTGAEGRLWMDTLQFLQSKNKPVILRMPIIPGINDNPEHFAEAKDLMKNFSVIQKLEIMPYHTIGSDKWNRIGLTYSLSDLPGASSEQASFWRSMTAD